MNRLSIIIPTLNHAGSIQRAVESIRRQNFDGEVQIIVSDAGSTDSTFDRVKAIGGVPYISGNDGCLIAAANRGLDAATGEFLCLLPGGAYLLADALRQLSPALADYPLVAGRVVDLSGAPVSPLPANAEPLTPQTILLGDAPAWGGTFFSRSLWQECGPIAPVASSEIEWLCRAASRQNGFLLPHYTCASPANAFGSPGEARRYYHAVQTLAARYLNDDEQFNLQTRSQLHLAKINDDQSGLQWILRMVQTESRITGQTKQWIETSGIVPRYKSKHDRPAAMPDLNWLTDNRAAA